MLLLLFFGSGCAALIYEIVWFQLLQLVIGLTTVSLGLVLGLFMGGMGLGGLLLPRLVSARCQPLRVYAALEIGIAVIGVLIPSIVPGLSNFYTAHATGGFNGVLLRGSMAALCLLPPTVLMGATLPAMARWIETTRSGVSWLGFFYGGNILGAVGGCLLTGFYLLRVYDMATATYVAAGINLFVAGMALVLASRDDWKSRPNPLVNPAPANCACSDSDVDAADQSARGVHWAIGFSGMAALGAEVVWTRLLSLVMGGTVYTFSIILGVFLIGLGLGSTVGSFLARTVDRPRRALGICQLLLMLAIAWTATMIAHSLPYWPINPSLALSPWFTFQLDLARGLWAVLPAAILWGASFPLALAAVAARRQDPGRLVGGLYAANTMGAILGALIFSLWLVPNFGTRAAQQCLVGISAAAAVLLFYPARRTPAVDSVVIAGTVPPVTPIDWRLGSRGAALALLVLMLVITGTLPAVPWGLAAYGRFLATYGTRLAPGIVAAEKVPVGGTNPDIYCTYVGEGLNGTIAVTQWTSGVRSFHSAGKVQASSDSRDMRLQRMLGHLSALVHQKPESILVVACGAGVTAGTFVTHPETKHIVICDIEPLVPTRVAPMFAKENHNVVDDPRTRVVIDDGRHFIRTTHEMFDIITSDPIDPWVKGCAALNTVEYYELCKAHLKPGGVMSLWLPLYESNPETVRSLVATFFKVFPNGTLWSNENEGEGYDAVLLAQVEPTRIDVGALQARLDRPDHAAVKRSLAEAGFPLGLDLLQTYAGQARDLQPWMTDAQINNDRNLRLQYLAGWSANSYMGAEILNGILRYKQFPENLFFGSEPQLQSLRGPPVKTAPGGVPPTLIRNTTVPR